MEEGQPGTFEHQHFSHGAEEWLKPKKGLGDTFPPGATLVCQEPGGITATFWKAGVYR